MKKFFIAYRHTGEDILELERRISTIDIALASKGIKAYATLFDEAEFKKNQTTAGNIMEKAFQKISAMDGLFVLIAGSEKSEGQLSEVGFALALKKPVIVARQEDASTYVHELTNLSFEYTDLDDLSKKITELSI
jgi:nucleoside 2-deoxyribosyltransferase